MGVSMMPFSLDPEDESVYDEALYQLRSGLDAKPFENPANPPFRPQPLTYGEALTKPKAQVSRAMPNPMDLVGDLQKPLVTPDEANSMNVLSGLNNIFNNPARTLKFHFGSQTTPTGPIGQEIQQANQNMQRQIQQPMQLAMQERKNRQDVIGLLDHLQTSKNARQLHDAQMGKIVTESQRMQDESRPDSTLSKRAQESLMIKLPSIREAIQNNAELYGGRASVAGTLDSLEALQNSIPSMSYREIKENFGDLDKISDNAASVARNVATAGQAGASLEESKAQHRMANAIAWANLDERKAARERAERERAEKRGKELREVAVNYMDFADPENVLPTPDDKKKVAAGSAAARTIISKTAEMRKLIQERGLAINPNTPDGQKYARLRNDIIVAAKTADELGALSGPDMGIETAKIPDATSLWSYALGKDKLLENLDQFDSLVIGTAADNAVMHGYNPSKFVKAAKSGELLKGYMPDEARVPAVKPKSGANHAKSVTAAEVQAYADKYFGGDIGKAKSTLKGKGYNVQ